MSAKSLLSDKMTTSLNLLNQKLFNGNRILDRIMTTLKITFVMPKTEATLHVPLAHKYPLFADELGSYMEGRNQIVDYPETMADVSLYTTPLEAFQKYLDYQIELEDMIQECINTAMDESDTNTKVFLYKFLLEVQTYTDEALLLVDKAIMYGDNPKDWMIMDSFAEDLLIPELTEEGD